MFILLVETNKKYVSFIFYCRMSPGIDAQAARLGELLRPIQDEKAAMEYVFNFVVKYNRDYRIVEENTVNNNYLV